MAKFIGIVLTFLVCSQTVSPLFSENRHCEFIVESPNGQQYEMISQLGRGSKGTVFLAKDCTDRRVALKRSAAKEELLQNTDFPPEVVDRLYSSDGLSLIALLELQKSHILQHASFLKIEDCFACRDSDGYLRTYLVMEFINGEILGKIPRCSHSREQALENAICLLEALQQALSQRLIHHDLDSFNIMIDENQQLKLIDLDSFDEVRHNYTPNHSDDNTQREYLIGVFHTLRHVIACGQFEEPELDLIWEKMSQILDNPAYQTSLDRFEDLESLNFYSMVFQDLKNLLVSKSKAGAGDHPLFSGVQDEDANGRCGR